RPARRAESGSRSRQRLRRRPAAREPAHGGRGMARPADARLAYGSGHHRRGRTTAGDLPRMQHDARRRDMPPAAAPRRPGTVNASPPRVSYPGISSEAYEHPLAQAALSTVRKAKGFDLVLKKAVSTTTEAIVRMHHLASAVKVGDTQ